MGLYPIEEKREGDHAWRNFVSKTKRQARSQNMPGSMLQREKALTTNLNPSIHGLLKWKKIKCLDNIPNSFKFTM